MRKGDLVRLSATAQHSAFRHLAEDERQAWLLEFQEDVRQGRERWHDDAGEPRLVPRSVTVMPTPGRLHIVLRARVRAAYNYQPCEGLCEVVDPESGVTFFVSRADTSPLEIT